MSVIYPEKKCFENKYKYQVKIIQQFMMIFDYISRILNERSIKSFIFKKYNFYRGIKTFLRKGKT